LQAYQFIDKSISFALRANFIILLFKKTFAAWLAYLLKVGVCFVLKLKIFRLVINLGETSKTLKYIIANTNDRFAWSISHVWLAIQSYYILIQFYNFFIVYKRRSAPAFIDISEDFFKSLERIYSLYICNISTS